MANDRLVTCCCRLRRERRVILELPEHIEAFVADHFGDTHTLSVPRFDFRPRGWIPAGFRVCEDVHLLVRSWRPVCAWVLFAGHLRSM